jgi:hypothetical protein
MPDGTRGDSDGKAIRLVAVTAFALSSSLPATISFRYRGRTKVHIIMGHPQYSLQSPSCSLSLMQRLVRRTTSGVVPSQI